MDDPDMVRQGADPFADRHPARVPAALNNTVIRFRTVRPDRFLPDAAGMDIKAIRASTGKNHRGGNRY